MKHDILEIPLLMFNLNFQFLPQLPQSLQTVSSINHSTDSGDSRTSGQFERAVNRTLWWLSGDVGEDVTLLSPLNEKIFKNRSRQFCLSGLPNNPSQLSVCTLVLF